MLEKLMVAWRVLTAVKGNRDNEPVFQSLSLALKYGDKREIDAMIALVRLYRHPDVISGGARDRRSIERPATT